jgi:lipoprotein NlpI
VSSAGRRALSIALLVFFVAGGACAAHAGAADDISAARAAEKRGDDAGAVRLLTRALARTDLRGAARGDVYIHRAAILERQKRYAAVISDMQHAVALRPHFWVAYYGLGVGYHLNGEPKRAIAAYNQGLASASADPSLFIGRGRAYHTIGDDRRARADFERAIAIDPRYPFTYLNLGMLESQQLHYDAAFAYFDRVVKLDPAHADGYEWRGVTSFLRNQPAAARADLSRAISLDPTSMNAYRWRGLVNFMDREFSDAAADFASAARLQPSYPYAALWTYVARLKLKIADTAELRTASARSDRRAWPAPIFALFLGEQTYAGVLARAGTGVPAATAAGNRCEAAFYAGELALSRDDVATARPLFDEASKTCPVHYVEHRAAVAELQWLDAQPTPAASGDPVPRVRNLERPQR